MLFYLKFMYLYCLAFTADWLFNLKASHERGRTVEHLRSRAQKYASALRICAKSALCILINSNNLIPSL